MLSERRQKIQIGRYFSVKCIFRCVFTIYYAAVCFFADARSDFLPLDLNNFAQRAICAAYMRRSFKLGQLGPLRGPVWAGPKLGPDNVGSFGSAVGHDTVCAAWKAACCCEPCNKNMHGRAKCDADVRNIGGLRKKRQSVENVGWASKESPGFANESCLREKARPCTNVVAVQHVAWPCIISERYARDAWR